MNTLLFKIKHCIHYNIPENNINYILRFYLTVKATMFR
jgi:hypothetical protein